MSKTIVVGNNLGCLVCANELEKAGHEVMLISTTPKLGGHPVGIDVLNDHFDLGMTYLEFESIKDQTEDLSKYDTDIKNNSGQYVEFIQNYLSAKGLSFHKVPMLKAQLNNKIYDDFIMSDSLDFVSDFPMLSEELNGRNSDHPLHAKNKNQNIFLDTPFEEVSLYNHGPSIHKNIIEPLCKKITGRGTDQVMARYHRIAWLPLYYPESLISPNLKKINFYYPNAHSMAVLPQAFDVKNVVIGKIDSLNYDGAVQLSVNNQQYQADHLVWGLNPEVFLKLTNLDANVEFDKAGLSVCFAKVKANDKSNFSTMYIPESHTHVFRMTNQTVCSNENSEVHKIIFELSRDCPDPEREVNQISKSLGLEVVEMDTKELDSVLMLPNVKNYSSINKLRSQIPENIYKMANSAGFTMNSLNDVILQGIKTSQEILSSNG